MVVHAASVSETAGARLVLAELTKAWWRLRLIWLDGGYKESLFEWIKTIKRWRAVRIEQVKGSDEQKGFAVLPKRWVVERTFGWLVKHRRLSKDYEALCVTSEAMVYVAMIRLMLARLDASIDFSDTLLEGFPGVTREQAEAVLDLARQNLLEEVSPR